MICIDFCVIYKYRVKQLIIFERTVAAASDFKNCTMVNCDVEDRILVLIRPVSGHGYCVIFLSSVLITFSTCVTDERFQRCKREWETLPGAKNLNKQSFIFKSAKIIDFSRIRRRNAIGVELKSYLYNPWYISYL